MGRKSQILLALYLLSVASAAQAQYHPGHVYHPGAHFFHPGIHHPHAWLMGGFYGPGMPYANPYVPLAMAAGSYASGAQMQYQQQALQVAERQVELDREDRRARISRIEARRSDQEAVSQRRTEQRLAKPRRQAAERLASDELSPNGTLAWPAVLSGKEYRAQRDEIERFFAERATGGGARASLSSGRAAQRIADEMLVELKRHIKQLGTRDYLAAQSFVRRLALEARCESGVTQLAGQ